MLNITWLLGLLFAYLFLFFFVYFMVYVLCRLWVMFWWGVLFFCLCTTTYVYASCCPHSVYSYIFFFSLLCFVYLFLYSHMPLVLLLPLSVCFVHAWMETFGGVCICIICNYVWILKCVYLTYFVISDIISQDKNVKHGIS